MKWRDYVIASACAILWGLTFPIIKGVSDFVPAVFLTSCRFLVIAFAVFFIPFPSIGILRYFSFSFLFGCGQYLLSTLSIYFGLSAGVASVIMQTQIFVTLGLCFFFLGERFSRTQLLGVCIGFAGMVAFLFFNSYFSISMLGILSACFASFAWACVNMIVKTSKIINFTALVAWGALPNIPILFGISWVMGDFNRIDFAVDQWFGFIASLVFLGLIVTFGVSILWNGLIRRYNSIQIMPFTLLIPVVGLSSSGLIFSDFLARQFFPVSFIFFGLGLVIYSSWRSSINSIDNGG